MTIRYEFELSDWLRFQEHYLRQSRQIQITKNVLFYGVPVLLALSLLLIDHGQATSIMVWIDLALILTLSSFWMWYQHKTFYKKLLARSAKMMTQNKEESLLGQHVITFEKDHLNLTAPGISTQISYNQLHGVFQSDKDVYLYLNTSSALIIPLEKIEFNAEEKAAFEKTLATIKEKIIG